MLCTAVHNNEKGRVERAIRYIRGNFYTGRYYTSLDDLNQQARVWCDTTASNRPCPEDKSASVQDTFLKEQPRLIALPDNPYPCEEVETVSVGKTPYVRFDLNDYSVPHVHVQKTLVVRATLDCVTILDGTKVIATHARSYDKAKQVESPEHMKELVARKRAARLQRGQDRLMLTIDCAREFLVTAGSRGYALKSITRQLTSMLDDYGAILLEKAMVEALANTSPHPNSVRMVLEKMRDEQQEKPLATFALSTDRRITGMVVKTHALNQYDALQTTSSTQEKK